MLIFSPPQYKVDFQRFRCRFHTKQTASKMKDIALLLLLPFISGTLQAQIAAWHFDKIEKTEIVKPLERRKIPSPEVDRSFFVTEDISGTKGKILGAFHKSVEGVVGNALQLDGNTSFIEMPLNANLKNDFSIGAWIALGAFPTHWCPVADQNINTKKGFFLGIDAYGHAGVKAYIGGKLVEIQSTERILLRKWTHIQGVFSPKQGLLLYVNGKQVASVQTSGDFESANSAKILIGKSTILQKPEGTVRPNGTQPVYTFFDGLIDELKIYDTPLSSADIEAYFNKTKPQAAPALAPR